MEKLDVGMCKDEEMVDSDDQVVMEFGVFYYVYLLVDIWMVLVVGVCYGVFVIFEVVVQLMYWQGYMFFVVENDVWLIDVVLVEYFELIDMCVD